MNMKQVSRYLQVKPREDIESRNLVGVSESLYSPFDDKYAVTYTLTNGQKVSFRIKLDIDLIQYFAFDLYNLFVDLTDPIEPQLLWDKAVFVSSVRV